jgi:predicted nucleic acid-binding protein
MIAFDTTYLALLLGHPDPKPPTDPEGNSIDDLQERMDLLVERFENTGEIILIPQPAYSEFLVRAYKDGPKYTRIITKSALYKFGDFELKAAIELAEMRRKELKEMSKSAIRRETPAETKAKVSFDRQIIAIAKANRAHTIYSNDKGVRNCAERHKLKAVPMWQLPRPVAKEQMTIDDLIAEAEKARATDEGGPSESGS